MNVFSLSSTFVKSALYRVYFTNCLLSLLSGCSDAMALWVDSGQVGCGL